MWWEHLRGTHGHLLKFKVMSVGDTRRKKDSKKAPQTWHFLIEPPSSPEAGKVDSTQL
jgi:hypothetical protein